MVASIYAAAQFFKNGLSAAATAMISGVPSLVSMYDSGDLGSMSQLLTGTTAAAPGSVVGRIQDLKPANGRTFDAYVAQQTELMPGGDFTVQADVDAWTIVTPASMTKSLVGGKMRLVNTNTTYCYRAVTTVIGTWYRVTGTVTDVSVTGNPFRQIRKADNTTASVNVVNMGSGNSGFNTPNYFRATATTTYIVIQVNVITGGDVNTVDVDDFSVKSIGTATPLLAPSTGTRPILRAQPYMDFDVTDDVLQAQILSNLGSSCALYYRTQAGADTWVTGQTVSTPTFAVSNTDWSCAALFSSEPSPSEKLLVQSWGAVPRVPFSDFPPVLIWGDSFATTNLQNALKDLTDPQGYIEFSNSTIPGGSLQVQAAALEAIAPVSANLIIMDGGLTDNYANAIDAINRMRACLNPGYKLIYIEPSPQFYNTGSPQRIAQDAIEAQLQIDLGSDWIASLAPIQTRGNGGGTDNTYIADGIWPLSLMISDVDFHPTTSVNSAGWSGVTALAKVLYDAGVTRGYFA